MVSPSDQASSKGNKILADKAYRDNEHTAWVIMKLVLRDLHTQETPRSPVADVIP